MTTTPRPQSLKYAVWLMYAGAVLALIAGVAGTADAHTMAVAEISAFRKQAAAQPGMAVPPVSLFTTIFTVAYIAGGVVDALLWLWMAWKNGQGRSWARVLSTVFFGFLCVGMLLSLLGISTLGYSGAGVSGSQIGSLVVGVLNFAVGLAAIILLYRPDSSQYFQAVRMERLGGYPPVPGAAPYYGYGTPQSTYGYGAYPPPPPNPEDPPSTWNPPQ